jgi:hypothetical protein
MSTPPASQKRELTVRLVVDPAGDLSVSYYRAGFGLVKQTTPKPLRQFGADLQVGDHRGVDAINALLNVPDEKTLETGLCGHQGEAIGALLFALLFPDEQIWRPVLAGLLGVENPDRVSPLKQSLRLRIWTEHPALLALPWRLTTWNRQWLLNSQWTFELTSVEQPSETLALHTPCRVLVVIPHYQPAEDGLSDLDGATHLEAVKERLRGIDPRRLEKDYFQVCTSISTLADKLANFRPELVYYFGHGSTNANRPVLEFGRSGGGRLLVAQIKQMIADPPPRILFLNGCYTGAGGQASAGMVLSPDILLIIGVRTQAFRRYAEDSALDWFGDVLRGIDPVAALHRVNPTYSQLDFQWCTHSIHAAYRDARLVPGPPEVFDPIVPLRLDRDGPRGRVLKHVGELIRHGKRKVEALVICAPSGPFHLEEFWQQAIDEIERSKLAQVKRLRIKLPDPCDESDQQTYQDLLDREVCNTLGVDPGETLIEGFRRYLGERLPGPKQLLWIDFGVCGHGAGATLPAIPIHDWLSHCRDLLVREAHELSLIAYLGVETNNEDSLEREIFAKPMHEDRFVCSLLEALRPIREYELQKYLSDPDHCDPALVADATALIFAQTKGSYEDTVALIKEGQQRGWNRLLHRLRKLQGTKK